MLKQSKLIKLYLTSFYRPHAKATSSGTKQGIGTHQKGTPGLSTPPGLKTITTQIQQETTPGFQLQPQFYTH